jgi:hypothetical protein
MIHPRDQGKATTREEIAAVVGANPNINFVFHGHETQGTFQLIEPLMDEYSNVYFSIDFPNWNVYWDGVSQNRPRRCDACSSIFWGSSQEASGSSATDVFQASLAAAGGPAAAAARGAALAAEKIAEHPGRIMWGTDRFHVWHYDRTVSQSVIEISRLLIGALPPEVQQPFAFGNAEALFSSYLDPSAEPPIPPTSEAGSASLALLEGDKLAIPSVGIEGALALYVVGPSGAMPDPTPSKVGLYDFTQSFGSRYGGTPGTRGNAVFVGRQSTSGLPGPFFALSDVREGDIVELTYQGALYTYSVMAISEVHQTDGDWDLLLEATQDETITIISDGSQNHRLVVQAERLPE